MGNSQSYSVYWSSLQTHIRDFSEMNVSEQQFIVTNTASYKTYYITRRMLHSQHLFLATDDHAAKVMLKLFVLPCYDEVKKLHIFLKRIQGQLAVPGVVKILDFFFTYDKGKWVFVVVEEFIRGLSMESWLQNLNSEPLSVPIDFAVCAFYSIVKRVQEAHAKGLVLKSISAENIIFEKIELSSEALLPGDASFYSRKSSISQLTPESPEACPQPMESVISSWEGEPYIVKLTPYRAPTAKILNPYIPPEGLTNRQTFDIWCCGVLLLCVSCT
jgi:serine/threonine protein kinase